jgi:XTP/dITP diphosphohydrolase
VPAPDRDLRIFAATKNAGKLRELRALFAPWGWRLEGYREYADVVEGTVSYSDNAALKARALRGQLVAAGMSGAVLGDDSGLEVAALSGRPGVLSARYGGAAASWPERRRALLAELEASGSSDRHARFVCALHLIGESGDEFAVECDVKGVMAPAERGDAGFSYDAIFEYPPLGQTFAQLSEEEKNAVSHRGRAVRALVEMVSADIPKQ